MRHVYGKVKWMNLNKLPMESSKDLLPANPFPKPTAIKSFGRSAGDGDVVHPMYILNVRVPGDLGIQGLDGLREVSLQYLASSNCVTLRLLLNITNVRLA